MIDENLISDISYTSKDFNSIYPELLDLVKKLSNKWDPSLSNESDPGVLLLKLNAIIADKNNYNIDKNVLECFPLSVTQDANARKLYELLGYNMHWYVSATTNIGFEVIKTANIPAEGKEIPAFTPIVDSTKEIVYTTLQPINIAPSLLNIYQETLAIEGTVLDYSINNENISKITFDNLDSDLRLYFQDTMVAENGIFIADASIADSKNAVFGNELLEGSTWKRVDNLAAYPLGSYVFQFGVLPNTNTCYIQFPEDVATLISSGIYIKYTLTKGNTGNIKGSTLSLFLNNIIGADETPINSNIKISQPIGTNNGRDPETLSESYKNYKKTIGTFNTLVTCRDYENYIYNIEENNRPLISNIKVSDRTNDINYSDHVQVWYPAGNNKVNLFRKYNNNDILNAYNIVLYMLYSPISIYDKSSYNSSYATEKDPSKLYDIEDKISDIKSIQHDLYSISNNNLYGPWSYKKSSADINNNYKIVNIENRCALKGSLITYNKITKKEANDIEKNVINALYKKYNSREVTFGQEISYDDLVKTIQEADARIKTLVLNIPTYAPKYSVIEKDGTNTYLDPQLSKDSNQTVLNTINDNLVARMVLSGNVQLFKFEDDFQLDFGQSDIEVTSIIKSITSETLKTLEVGEQTLNINENETIQLMSPSLITTVEYGAYVKVTFQRTDDSTEAVKIDAKKDTPIPDNTQLIITYKDSIGNNQTITYNAGTVINSSINLATNLIDSVPKTENTILTSGQSIKIKELNKTSLQEGTKYYFLLNNTDNRLEISPDEPYILQENEYFIYTSSASNELVILGSGTMLTSTATFDKTIERIDQDEITSDNIGNIDWEELTQELNLIEMEIITLGQGSSITNYTGTSSIEINNTPEVIPSGVTIEYKVDDVPNNFNSSIISNINSYIQSRLFINANRYEAQTLIEDQSFVFTYVDNTQSAKIEDTKVLFNNPVKLSGGNNIDVKVLNEYGESEYTLKAMLYELDPNTAPVSVSDGTTPPNKNNKGYYVLNKNYKNKTITFNFGFDANTKYFIPVYVNMSQGENKTIEFTNVSKLNYLSDSTDTDISATESINKSFILYIEGEKDNFSITLPNFGDNDSITIGKINKVTGYNEEEINSNDANFSYTLNGTSIETLMKNILNDSSYIFDVSYRVPEANKVLQPTVGSSYWNINHIYNTYTLPKIDFDLSKVTINPANLI